MRCYHRQHRHSCGIDLHLKRMDLGILDAAGAVLGHRHVKSTPEAFLETIAPYRDDLVVGAECRFTWYGRAAVCAAAGITFGLGHARAMKAIHGGQVARSVSDSDQDSFKLPNGNASPAALHDAMSAVWCMRC